jgi:hypothetical protein
MRAARNGLKQAKTVVVGCGLLRKGSDRGLAVTLWVLASLIAEVELLSWVFAHMYGS